MCVSDQIAKVYIVSGLQPNGQSGFRLQAVWIQTAVFSPASQLGSMDSDCKCGFRLQCQMGAVWIQTVSVDSDWLVIT